MSELIGFLVTNFDGHYPVGTAAIVYATDREHCKRLLLVELREQGLGEDNPDEWTITPLAPYAGPPIARVVLNGDY